MGVESYKHKFAKETLAGWFRDGAEHDFYKRLGPISWRVNRDAPNFGVWVEYPIALDSKNQMWGASPAWDEYDYVRWQDFAPTYQEVLDLGMTPITIFDVAIQHKGHLVYGIEVVHRHGITPEKLDFLQRIVADSSLQVYTIAADWILSRVGTPNTLTCERVL